MNREGVRLNIENINKAIEGYIKTHKPVVLKLKKMFIEVHETFYDEYIKAGCPFGDSEKGLMSWLKLLKLRADLEYRENYKKEVQQMIKIVKK